MFAVLGMLMMVTAMAYGMTDGPSYRPEGPTFKEIKDLVKALEKETSELPQQLGELTTLCAVNQDTSAKLFDRLFPLYQADDARQDKDIEELGAWIKALAHRVDEDLAKAAETRQAAQDTNEATQNLRAEINSTVVEKNMAQALMILDLDGKVHTIKTNFLDDLEDSLDNLDDQLTAETNKTMDLFEHLKKRKCEYGVGTFHPGMHNVTFQTVFSEEPTVSLQMVGFLFDLEKKDHHKGYKDYEHELDVLAMDKYVQDSTTEGFTVKLMGDTQGSVDLKAVVCNWLACQKLD